MISKIIELCIIVLVGGDIYNRTKKCVKENRTELGGKDA